MSLFFSEFRTFYKLSLKLLLAPKYNPIIVIPIVQYPIVSLDFDSTSITSEKFFNSHAGGHCPTIFPTVREHAKARFRICEISKFRSWSRRGVCKRTILLVKSFGLKTPIRHCRSKEVFITEKVHWIVLIKIISVPFHFF